MAGSAHDLALDQPLSAVHPYVRDNSLFADIETAFREAVISYGEALRASADAGRSYVADDLREGGRATTARRDHQQIAACRRGGGRPEELLSVEVAEKRTLERLLGRLVFLEPMPTLDEDTKTYLEHYRMACEYIYPQRLPRDQRAQDVAVPLSDVYVSLSLGPETADELTAEHALGRDSGDAEPEWTESSVGLDRPHSDNSLGRRARRSGRGKDDAPAVAGATARPRFCSTVKSAYSFSVSNWDRHPDLRSILGLATADLHKYQ